MGDVKKGVVPTSVQYKMYRVKVTVVLDYIVVLHNGNIFILFLKVICIRLATKSRV